MSRLLRFTLTIEMLSDWVVGSGSGRQGSIDSLVERDADGLPFVPSTTLRGIWRDAAEQLAFALDETPCDGPWADLVGRLFGSQPAIERQGDAGVRPLASRLRVADACLPPEIKSAVVDTTFAGKKVSKQPARNAFAYLKPGVKIDPCSGRAKTDYLRFEEVARKGAILASACSIELSGDNDDEALVALAFAAMRLVERIGGDRRRGLGGCKLSVTDVRSMSGLLADVDAAVAKLESLAPLAGREGVVRPPAITIDYADAVPDRRFHVIDLAIELLGPMVIADAVLGNVVTTLDFIPGSLLLAPASELLRNLGITPEAIWPRIACGDIRVLPATPEFPAIGKGAPERGLPVPFVFDELKSGPPHAPRWRNRLVPSDDKSGQYKPARAGYVRVVESGPTLTLEKIVRRAVVRTHNSVDDDRQKPSEEAGGGVYVNEALEAGLRLRSELWIRKELCDDAKLRAALKDLDGKPPLEGSVGRAKRAGYGRIAIRPTLGVAPDAPSIKDGEATLYFETDALLPAALALSPQDHIAAELGVDAIKIVEGDVRTRRQDGWLARWGLPRASFVTIAAGSTVRITGSGLGVALSRLAVDGMGARRGEGFGRVRVNNPLVTLDIAKVRKLEKAEQVGESTRAAPVQALSAAAKSFLVTIEREAVSNAILLAAEIQAADRQNRETALGWREDVPSMSQLGALRSVMNGLAHRDDRQRTVDFLASLRGSDRAQRWGGEVIIDKLVALFTQPEDVFNVIALEDETLIASSAVSTPTELRARYGELALASFLSAAMRAHKRDLEKSGEAG